jgi:hypothetical protein
MRTNTQTTGPLSQDRRALRRRDFLANTAVGIAGLVAVGPAYAASEPPRARGAAKGRPAAQDSDGPRRTTRVRRPTPSARSLGFVEAPGVEPM